MFMFTQYYSLQRLHSYRELHHNGHVTRNSLGSFIVLQKKKKKIPHSEALLTRINDKDLSRYFIVAYVGPLLHLMSQPRNNLVGTNFVGYATVS